MPHSTVARILFLIILALAAILRLANLHQGDPLNDEVAYAFRAVALIDSYAAEETPLEKLDPNRPSWLSFSFHDHPPLVFWVQHAAITLFGETLWAARLPSALLGIISVWLIFLIGRRIATRPAPAPAKRAERSGLIAAALLAATIHHVYISRTAQQEAYVIFFLLLGIWFALKSREQPRYLIALGVTAGLGFLAKYTTLVLFPIAAVLLTPVLREHLRRREFWIGAAAAVLVASPVLIYNFQLWRTLGHFDLQFAYLFGNAPESWQQSPGKDIGSLGHRIAVFLPRLGQTNSWLFLSFAVAAIAGFAAGLTRAPRDTFRRFGVIAASLVAVTLLLLAIGPSIRFLALLTPFLALAIGIFLDRALTRLPQRFAAAGIAAVVFFAAFEAAYSWNNEIAAVPVGSRPWFISPLQYETPRLGYTELEAWFAHEFANTYPVITFETTFAFTQELQERSIRRMRQAGASSRAALIVTYGDFTPHAELWTFERRRMHQGWPILSLADYQAAIAEQGPEFFAAAGFTELHIVISATMVIPDALKMLIATPGTEETAIQNPAGKTAFRIFTIPLTQAFRPIASPVQW
ncbi:phospholipid carrier-dependent glycosyltransferase [Candidatus Parcubacteria bacterium]|nr:MAG: phospholipid carrier-dependent glycosyltransferase [Candidatus Parcubacteria bacterium]